MSIWTPVLEPLIVDNPNEIPMEWDEDENEE